jgi:hypothetical protein
VRLSFDEQPGVGEPHDAASCEVSHPRGTLSTVPDLLRVRDLIPTVRTTPASLEQVGLGLDDDVRDMRALAGQRVWEELIVELAAELLDAAYVPLGDHLPSLHAVAESDLPRQLATARARNFCYRTGLTTVGTLVGLKVADLLELRGAGVGTVSELLAGAVRIALFADPHTAAGVSPRPTPVEPSGPPPSWPEEPAIADVLPLLGALPDSGLRLGLSLRSPASVLPGLLAEDARASDEEIERFVADVAERLSPDRTLLGQLPRLRELAAIPLDGFLTTQRARNVIALQRWQRVGDVAAFSPARIADLRQVGGQTVTDLLQAAVWIALFEPAPGAAPAEMSPIEPDPAEGLALAFVEALRLAATWAADVPLSELRQLAEPHVLDAMPRDVRGPLQSAAAVRPVALARRDLLANSCGDLLWQAWTLLSERDQTTVSRRLLVRDPPTLQAIADEIGVSRQRVSQVEHEARERLEMLFRGTAYSRVRWRAAMLRRKLGTAAPADHPQVHEWVAEALGDHAPEHAERLGRLLLWCAGPYVPTDDGWWEVDPPSADELVPLADECNLISIAAVEQWLLARGVSAPFHAAWLDRAGFRRFDEHVAVWRGSVLEKCLTLLALRGKPATVDELVAAIGEGHSISSTRNRLVEDPRVVKVNRTEWALRSWEMEEYTTIADEIRQRIDEGGGSASIPALVRELTDRFRVAENSVRAYMDAPMFVKEGDLVRLRRPDEPFLVQQTIASVRGAYRRDPDGMAYVMPVDGDVLRGSGRGVPPAVAAYLGVLPGQPRTFATPQGEVLVSWPITTLGPAIGSVRDLAAAVGAVLGDGLRLDFDRAAGTLRAERVPAEPEGEDLDRLSVLTGLTFDEDPVAAVAAALGVPVGEVRPTLRRRGDAAVADLLPRPVVAPEMSDALAALADALDLG